MSGTAPMSGGGLPQYETAAGYPGRPILQPIRSRDVL